MYTTYNMIPDAHIRKSFAAIYFSHHNVIRMWQRYLYQYIVTKVNNKYEYRVLKLVKKNTIQSISDIIYPLFVIMSD